MKNVSLFIAILFAMTLNLNAQKISGSVKDSNGNPVAGASITLLKAQDSALVKINATDKAGNYHFDLIQAGSYLVKVTNIGYSKKISPAITVADVDVVAPLIQLDRSATQLSGVTVTTTKPMVEMKADRMVVNVEGTVNATGNDGLELLRRSPGVMVDKDDNISMAGKTGVEVYIDGKPSPLKGTDLANYLRSIQSSTIESIELITNPGAKYEASGNAGIINIKLKKNKAFGTNGSVTAGYNIGTYAKYNGGIALNHRSKKANYFGNYNYSNGLNVNSISLYREIGDTIFDQSSIMKREAKSHTFKAGADFYLNSKNTLGVLFNGSVSDNNMNTTGPMTITPRGAAQPAKILDANPQTKMSRDNYNGNINYKYADTSGRTLNIDLDYGKYNNNTNQYVPNIYYDGTHTHELSRNIYRMITPSDIDIYSAKVDYEQNFMKGKLGYGGKLNWVQSDNEFNYYKANTPPETKDNNNYNHFVYTENVNALYINYNKQYKGFMVQAGVRGEQTHSKGRSANMMMGYDSLIDRKYLDLFPSAAFTINKNPMSQWSFTYSRRIDRPNYSNLNPFRFALNDYTYQQGNTELKPQYTNSFGVTHSYKYRLNTTVNYSDIKNLFAQIVDTLDKSKSYITTRNVDRQQVVSLNVSYPFSYKSYSLFSNLSANYSKYTSKFEGGSRSVNLDAFALTLFTQSSYKFAKTWTAEVSTLYISPFVWQGLTKGKAMGFVDAGLQRVIFKGNGTLKASVSDIFNTMHFRGESNYAGALGRVNVHWESRQFKLNFTYRLGSAQVKAARQRKTGLEDEKNRLGDGGGTPGQ